MCEPSKQIFYQDQSRLESVGSADHRREALTQTAVVHFDKEIPSNEEIADGFQLEPNGSIGPIVRRRPCDGTRVYGYHGSTNCDGRRICYNLSLKTVAYALGNYIGGNCEPSSNG